ncbi:DUF1479-domain-containing protein [Hymenopellis radicata]|nr:DUF1479-domain-containing protein [Hymenopellis radicata]
MSATPAPDHFKEIKKEIADSYPDFQERATRSWADILGELTKATEAIKKGGPNYIPQINFANLDNLSAEKLVEVKRKGCVVVRDVVDDAQALSWKKSLEEFVKANPDVDGVPEEDKQFFQLYWTKPQVEARAHPNMLGVQSWLNNLYHGKPGQDLTGVDLSTPLSYADRFRIRHPGVAWDRHPPHIDGGSIERWEDPTFRTCFEDILNGSWRKHDPFALGGRISARHSMYRRPNQSSIFRSFQGWLAMSETAPTQGTLKLFPDVLLSNAYLILRPFFRPLVATDSPVFLMRRTGPLTFHMPISLASRYHDLRAHVNPGDTVFWHCDMVHSVEQEHTGSGDSAVMYIPAVPLTPMNKAYIERQRESFVQGVRPPDFPDTTKDEKDFIGTGRVEDITNLLGKQAMGFPITVA